MSVPAEENMKADTFQNVPRSGKQPPPVPPKSPSLRGVHRTTKHLPDTTKSTSLGVYQNPKGLPDAIGVYQTPTNEDTPKNPPSLELCQTPTDLPDSHKSITLEVYPTLNNQDSSNRESLLRAVRPTQNNQDSPSSQSCGVYQTPKDLDMPNRQTLGMYQAPNNNENSKDLDTTHSPSLGLYETAQDIPHNSTSPCVGVSQTAKDCPVPPKSHSVRGVLRAQTEDTSNDSSLGLYQTPNQDGSNTPPLGTYQSDPANVHHTPRDQDITSDPSPVPYQQPTNCDIISNPSANQEGPSAGGSSISPAQACPPPVPRKTKSYLYLRPNISASGDSRQASSPSLVSTTEREPPPRSPRATRSTRSLNSPSQPRSSAEPDMAQNHLSESSAAGETTQPSQTTPVPVPPAPKTRSIYLTSSDINPAGCSATSFDINPARCSRTSSDIKLAGCSTISRDLSPGCSTAANQNAEETTRSPSESTPLLSAQVPKAQGVLSIETCPQEQEPAEYDTLLPDGQTAASGATPPPVPPKTKTRPRPQSVTLTTGSYNNKLPHAMSLPRLPALANSSDSEYQAPSGSLSISHLHTTESQLEARETSCPDGAVPGGAYADRDVRPPKPRPTPRGSHIQTAATLGPQPPAQRKPTQESLASQPAIYEPVGEEMLSSITQLSTKREATLSSNPLHPQPPPFSPPPPPTPSPRVSPRPSFTGVCREPSVTPSPAGSPHLSSGVYQEPSLTPSPSGFSGAGQDPISYPSSRVSRQLPSSASRPYQGTGRTPSPRGTPHPSSSEVYQDPISTLSPRLPSLSSEVYQEPIGTPYYVSVLPHLPGTQEGRVHQSHPSPGTPQTAESQPHHNTDTLPRKPLSGDNEGSSCRLSKMLETMKSFSFDSSRYVMMAEDKTQQLNLMANKTHMALKCFQSLLLTRGDALRSHITELQGIAGDLEKMSQRHKVAGITGGTASAAGGVAAVVGIALAPITMGASLIATAVGAGVAVAAGGVGAGSAIKKKKKKNSDVKRVEEIVKVYRDQVADLDQSLEMVRTGMAGLRRRDTVAGVTGASDETVWMAHVAQAVYQLGGATPSPSSSSPLSAGEVLKAFDAGAGEEVYSNNEGRKLKKGSEKKFGERVRTLAQQLQEALNDMTHSHEIFTLATASV